MGFGGVGNSGMGVTWQSWILTHFHTKKVYCTKTNHFGIPLGMHHICNHKKNYSHSFLHKISYNKSHNFRYTFLISNTHLLYIS